MKGKYEMLGRHTTSFHYVTPGEMYFIEFLAYDLKQQWQANCTTDSDVTESTERQQQISDSQTTRAFEFPLIILYTTIIQDLS